VKNIEDIYVPVDFSPVKQVIPQDEEIIYSTACIAKFSTGSSTKTFSSHLLITREGVAFTIPKRKQVVGSYVPWHEIFSVRSSKLCLTSLNILNLTNVKAYETKKKFKHRALEFPIKIAPLFLEKKIPWIQEQKERKKIMAPAHKRGVKLAQKAINSAKKKLGII